MNDPMLSELSDRALGRRQVLKLAAAATGAAAAVHLLGSGTANALDAVAISYVSNTNSSITITVTPGASGAPAGFFVVVLDQAIYAANGNTWPAGLFGPPVCKTAFTSGAPYAAGVPVTVTVDTCSSLCGKSYVVRALVNDPNTFPASNTLTGITSSPCVPPPSTGCTYTQGYWKTHGPSPRGNNTNVWPVTSLVLGTRSYSAAELQRIFDTPVRGNGLISLAHQLIAAKLNVANGASSTAVASSITAADALIGGLVVPPIGSGSLAASSTSALVSALTAYNEGTTGPGHCA